MVKCDYCQREIEVWITLIIERRADWLTFCSLKCLGKWVRDKEIIELRYQGKTLRQIAKEVSLSYEGVRQRLLKSGIVFNLPKLTCQRGLARMLGVSQKTLITKRRAGLLNPTRLYGRWVYSNEEIAKAKSLFERHCAGCEALLPKRQMKWCLVCKPEGSSRPKYRYWTAEQKKKHSEKIIRCRKRREMRNKKGLGDGA